MTQMSTTVKSGTSAALATETIAAIATPAGTAGLAVIRISGPDAITRTAEVFRGTDLRSVASHTVHLGMVVDDDGRAIDQVLATIFRAPQSYTGDDTVELGCHGGSAVSRAVLERLLGDGSRDGLRHALPGEFTRRAFLNGRMDLAQAEAVADLIHARTEEARLASMVQLEGALSRHVTALRERLVRCASLLELALDFAEEDVDLLSRDELVAELDAVSDAVARLLDGYRSGRVIRDGFRVALAGRPNAGKSSVLNGLVGSERAIVTDIPGTTRDFIEEGVVLGGVLVRLIDTAGLRASDDPVEQIGIARAHEVIGGADLTAYVIDASASDIVCSIAAHRSEHATLGARCEAVMLVNKCDLLDASARGSLPLEEGVVAGSTRTPSGLDAFEALIRARAQAASRMSEQGSVLVTNARHAACLGRTRAAVDRARSAVAAGRSEEYIALDIRAAIDAAGEVVGIVRSDDVLEEIFSRFCIGK